MPINHGNQFQAALAITGFCQSQEIIPSYKPQFVNSA